MHPSSVSRLFARFVLTWLLALSGLHASDLSISMSHAGNFWQGQTGATHTINVENLAPSSFQGDVLVTGTLPDGLTPTAISGTAWSCSISGKNFSAFCNASVSGNSAFRPITLTVNVASDAPPSVTATAAVSGGDDVNPTNNSATDATTITAPADLAVTMSHTGNFARGETGKTYTVTATNSGGALTSGLHTATISLPPGLTATDLAGTGWTPAADHLSATRSDPLAAGASFPPLTLTISVGAEATSPAWPSVTVSGGGQVNTTNDTATDATIVTGLSKKVNSAHAWGNNDNGQSAVPADLSGVVAVAAGSDHSLAMKADGTVVAWGNNGYGQTNVPAAASSGVVAITAGDAHNLALKADGTVIARGANWYGQTSVPAAATYGVVAVSAGSFHNLALKEDGTVVAWGYNINGQSTVPPGLSGVVAVAAGFTYSMALKADGTVIAWGGNNYGQRNVPSGLSGVVAIAAGDSHCLALKADGTVAAWGKNSDGQTNVPTGLSGVVAIAGGDDHSLALKADGTVIAWGANWYGQMNMPSGMSGVVAISAGGDLCLALKADGTVVAWGDNYFGQTTVPPGLSGVVAVAGGANHSLALKADGSVAAWGDNGKQQSTVPSAAQSGVVAVAAGDNHSLALKADGTVVAWGWNNSGQTNVPAGLSGVVAVAGGIYHSLALKADGTVVAWGRNDEGQTTVSDAAQSGVVAVAAGYFHSLALKANGTVVAWGNNDYGQTTVPGDLSGVVAVAAGYTHSLALKANGMVVAWGWNDFGQTDVPADAKSRVVAVAGGDIHSLALKSAWKTPKADSKAVEVGVNTAKAITLSVSDIGGSPVKYRTLVAPTKGTLTGTAPNLTYTPDSGALGSDTFSYLVNNGGLNSNIAVVSINIVAPKVISVSSNTANGTYKVGDTIDIDVKFDSNVTVTGTPQLLLETGGTGRAVDYVSGSGSDTLTFSYTVQEGDVSTNLEYESTDALTLNGGTINDSSGVTPAILTLPIPGGANSLSDQMVRVIDGIRPTANIVVADTALAANETTVVTITFSEVVYGLTAADFTVANGVLSEPSTSDGGITWTATLTPNVGTEDTDNLITLDNTGVTDLAGNAVTDTDTDTATTESNHYAIDTAAPGATALVRADPNPTSAASVRFTLMFSEDVSGVDTSDFTLATSGTTAGSIASVNPVNALTYTVLVNGISGTGTLGLNLNSSGTGIADMAGNPIPSGLAGETYAIDRDLPTVVGAGIPDQALSLGTAKVLNLSSYFTDIGSTSMTYLVTANSASGKVAAAISGGKLTLSPLANGVTNITVRANDGHGGTVSDTFEVAVGTTEAKALQIGSTGILNKQNGLYELTIKLTNTTARPINGFRLQVDYSDYKIAYPGLKLYNAKGSKKKFKTHIDYPFPVAANGVVSMKLRFYSRNRNLPPGFKPKLKVKELKAGQVTWPKGNAVAVRSVRLSNKDIQIEFPSVIGKWYRVCYSKDKIHWQDCLVPIKASTTRTQWIDSGAPFTAVPPSQVVNRYYRVNEIPAH